MYLLTSLTNFKKHLNKATSDTDGDDYLEELIEQATSDIELYTKRMLRSRTFGSNGLDEEYHDGNGSNKLLTNQYPIISVSSLYDDPNRDFASGTLKASTDYIILDEAGIIQLATDALKGTTFSVGSQNIKLIYTAGYEHFEVITDKNDTIEFQESDGGGVKTATLTADVYTISNLAANIKTKMELAGENTYTISYNYYTGLFQITTSTTYLKILVTSGTLHYQTALRTLGFNADQVDSSLVVTANKSVFGIPGILERACLKLATRELKESTYKGDRFDILRKDITKPMGGTIQYVGGEMPDGVARMLNPFRREPLI